MILCLLAAAAGEAANILEGLRVYTRLKDTHGVLRNENSFSGQQVNQPFIKFRLACF